MAAQIASAQQCRVQRPDDYDRDKFIVSGVSITSDDKSFGAVKDRLRRLLVSIPLQAQKEFGKADFEQSKTLVETTLTIIEPPDPLHVPLIHTRFEECNTTSHPATVKVVFDVSFAIQPLKTRSSAPPTYEQPVRNSTSLDKSHSGLQQILTTIQPQLYVGFTSSENLAGAGATIDLKNSLFRGLSLIGAGSSSAALGSASLNGDHTFASSGWLRELGWRAGYEYSKLPSGDGVELKRGTAFGQFFASTRAFHNLENSREFVIRYGGSFEGGNRQSNLNPRSNLIVSSGSYQSMKTYIGASGRLAQHLFKASYGLQVGGTGDEATGINQNVDFLKHIFDSSYKTRFLPWSNKPVSLEAQFTAGKVARRGLLPVTESFYGGNIDQNFIAGSAWVIRSTPYIRSFSNQRLTPTGLPLALGGQSFISTNLTFAATIWARPAIPKEAQTEIPKVFEILRTSHQPEVETLRKLLTGAFVAETDSYVQQIAKADYASLEKVLLRLQVDLNGLSSQGVTTPTRNLIARDTSDLSIALKLLDLIKTKIVFDSNGKFKSDNLDARPELVELLIVTVPEDPDDPDALPGPGVLTEIIDTTAKLLAKDDPPVAALRGVLDDRRVKLQEHSDNLRSRFDTFERDGLPEARQRTIKFLNSTESQIVKLGRELNTFAIGPVFMFDAARVRTLGASSGFRYGVGPGVQIEFFGLQLRGGYSFNPNRRPGEPKGAVTFSFDVADIFP